MTTSTHPNLTAFPLSWPTGLKRTSYRRASKFDTNFGRARDAVFRELKLLGATGVVFSSNVSLRKDGIPYANQANPDDPGVAVYFRWKGKDYVLAVDRWTKVEDNTHAVAKSIDAMRGLDRWGASEMVEAAFSGFAALPPAAPPQAKTWQQRFRDLWGFDAHTVGLVQAQERYRQLAMLHHPDRGGDAAIMSEVNRLYAEWKKSRGL